MRIAVSILFTVPHVIVLYTRTIASTCCMHTLMLTTSRHSLHVIHHRIMTVNDSINAQGQMLIKCKNSSVLSFTLTFNRESWSYYHIAVWLVLYQIRCAMVINCSPYNISPTYIAD